MTNVRIRQLHRNIGSLRWWVYLVLVGISLALVAACPGLLYKVAPAPLDALLPNLAATVIGILIAALLYDVLVYRHRRRESTVEMAQIQVHYWQPPFALVSMAMQTAGVTSAGLPILVGQFILAGGNTSKLLKPEQLDAIAQFVAERTATARGRHQWDATGQRLRYMAVGMGSRIDPQMTMAMLSAADAFLDARQLASLGANERRMVAGALLSFLQNWSYVLKTLDAPIVGAEVELQNLKEMAQSARR